MEKNLTEAYEKTRAFMDDNMESWIKEHNFTEEQVKEMYEVLGACESLGVDITSFEGWELI